MGRDRKLLGGGEGDEMGENSAGVRLPFPAMSVFVCLMCVCEADDVVFERFCAESSTFFCVCMSRLSSARGHLILPQLQGIILHLNYKSKYML